MACGAQGSPGRTYGEEHWKPVVLFGLAFGAATPRFEIRCSTDDGAPSVAAANRN